MRRRSRRRAPLSHASLARLALGQRPTQLHILTDGIMRNRTDGTPVCLVTPLAGVAGLPAADARLTAFMRQAMPLLPSYIPN